MVHWKLMEKVTDAEIRVRRYDDFNFVIEKKYIEPDEVKYHGKLQPNSRAGQVVWEVEGWFGNNLALCVKEALRRGMNPKDTKDLLPELKESEARLMEQIKDIEKFFKTQAAKEEEEKVSDAPKKKGRKPKFAATV